MPFDNIDRAVKKGTGELEGVIYEEVTYEVTDPVAPQSSLTARPTTRTAAFPKSVACSRRPATYGSQNAVAWMFDQKGLIEVDHAGVEEDALVEAAIELVPTTFRIRRNCSR